MAGESQAQAIGEIITWLEQQVRPAAKNRSGNFPNSISSDGKSTISRNR